MSYEIHHVTFEPLLFCSVKLVKKAHSVLTLYCVFIQDWEFLVLEKLKWDLVSVIANDFLDHILQRLSLPQQKVDLVKKHAQTFIALCATGMSCNR